jgi:hypothetical protein
LGILKDYLEGYLWQIHNARNGYIKPTQGTTYVLLKGLTKGLLWKYLKAYIRHYGRLKSMLCMYKKKSKSAKVSSQFSP